MYDYWFVGFEPGLGTNSTADECASAMGAMVNSRQADGWDYVGMETVIDRSDQPNPKAFTIAVFRRAKT